MHCKDGSFLPVKDTKRPLHSFPAQVMMMVTTSRKCAGDISHPPAAPNSHRRLSWFNISAVQVDAVIKTFFGHISKFSFACFARSDCGKGDKGIVELVSFAMKRHTKPHFNF